MNKDLDFWSDVQRAIKDWGEFDFENYNIFFKFGKTQKTARSVKLIRIYFKKNIHFGNTYNELIVRFKYEDGTLGFFKPYVMVDEMKSYFMDAVKKKILKIIYPPLERAIKEDKEIVDAYNNLVNVISRYVARRNNISFDAVKENFEKKSLVSLEY